MRNNIALIVVIAILAAGCEKQPEKSVQQAVETTEASAVPSITSVRFGSYVNSKTHRIGGGTTSFTQEQRIFAEVAVAGLHAPVSVGMRMKDESGEVLSELSRNMQGKNMHAKVNFAIGDASEVKPIPPGSYSVETLLNNEVLKTSKIIVRN